MTLQRTRPCPRCAGRGTIAAWPPKRAAAVERSREWAEPFNGQVVMVTTVYGERWFGVGVAGPSYGGYWRVRVYTPEIIRTPPSPKTGYIYQITFRYHGHPYPSDAFGYTFGRDKLAIVPFWDVPPDVLETFRPVVAALAETSS